MEMPTVPKNVKSSRQRALAKSAWEVLRRSPTYISDYRKYKWESAQEDRDQSRIRSGFPNLSRVRRPVVDSAAGRFEIIHGISPIDPAKPFEKLTVREMHAFSFRLGQQDAVSVVPDPDLEDLLQKKIDNVSLDPWSTKLILVVDARAKESVLLKKIQGHIRDKKKKLGLSNTRFRPEDVAIQMSVWSQKKQGVSNRRIARGLKLDPTLDYKSRNDRIKDLTHAAREKITASHRILDEARSEIT